MQDEIEIDPDRVAQYRDIYSLSQQELADKMEVSRGTIQRLEDKKTKVKLKCKYRQKLAEIFETHEFNLWRKLPEPSAFDTHFYSSFLTKIPNYRILHTVLYQDQIETVGLDEVTSDPSNDKYLFQLIDLFEQNINQDDNFVKIRKYGRELSEIAKSMMDCRDIYNNLTSDGLSIAVIEAYKFNLKLPIEARKGGGKGLILDEHEKQDIAYANKVSRNYETFQKLSFSEKFCHPDSVLELDTHFVVNIADSKNNFQNYGSYEIIDHTSKATFTEIGKKQNNEFEVNKTKIDLFVDNNPSKGWKTNVEKRILDLREDLELKKNRVNFFKDRVNNNYEMESEIADVEK